MDHRAVVHAKTDEFAVAEKLGHPIDFHET